MTDRGGAGGPEIAAAAVPPAGCRERKAETGGRWLGAGAARPRPRRMLSPCPVRPRAHDGDTGAQSVSSRGESCAAIRRGHPRPCVPSPSPAHPPRPCAPLPSPAAVGCEPARELLARSPAAASPGIRAGPAALGPGCGTLGGDRRSGRDSWPPPPRSLRPPRAFSFAFDNFLPAETLGYSAQAPDPFCLSGAIGLFTFGGGGGEVGGKESPAKGERTRGDALAGR